MCGRFAFFSPSEAITRAFGTDLHFQVEARYNLTPSQNVTVVTLGLAGELVVDQLRWGLVPFWAKDPAIGSRMINARAETVAEKPSYRQPFSRRRCLVLADGFYEWRKGTDGKTPFFISRADGQPFGMAGLWDEWSPQKVSGAAEQPEIPIRTCTVVTAPANDFMQTLHHRMPVLMGASELPRWLDASASKDYLLAMLLGPQNVGLQAWAVSKAVNNPINDSADLLLRADG